MPFLILLKKIDTLKAKIDDLSIYLPLNEIYHEANEITYRIPT